MDKEKVIRKLAEEIVDAIKFAKKTSYELEDKDWVQIELDWEDEIKEVFKKIESV